MPLSETEVHADMYHSTVGRRATAALATRWLPSGWANHRHFGCATKDLDSTLAAPPQKAKIQLAGTQKILWKTHDG